MKASEEAKLLKGVAAGVPSVVAAYLEELVFDWEVKGLPAVVVRRIGGSRDDTDRRPRYAVDAYALGTTAAADVIDDVLAAMQWDPHACSWHANAVAFVDDVEVESMPMPVPMSFTNDRIRQLTATLRVTRRDY